MTASPAFRVHSMTVHEPPIPAQHQTIHAQLAVEYGPLLIVGAALAQSADGSMRIWLPNFGRDRRVAFRDPQERERLLQIVLSAYRAFTGRDPADTPLAKAPSPDEVPS
ncbi:hypothetical protein LPC08_19225 [Roseomonas sp. OT10]|uniref:hypothetical protein n=1 Tax=Roseomonas cutis TaxID=2897332 RepID=UPI001E303BBD|nr:hypothetical protein [Roseomonas sp. OT10]UFN48127.1 hypothetical protein LPC08_19225 [Roseomonas sp. OT10]